MDYVIFFILAAIAVVGALNVAFRKNPVIGAMNLIMTILAVAGLYITLNAEFLAAVQIIVYAGAIMILFLFVILLINLDRELWDDFSVFKLPAPLLGVVLTVVLMVQLFKVTIPKSTTLAASPDPGSGSEVGRMLFTEFAFPFEVASIILFAGMIGAILLAKKRRVD
ncbi:MAG: NADH-quinone oxidoreductase subunit J [Planctomycetota bacterium]